MARVRDNDPAPTTPASDDRFERSETPAPSPTSGLAAGLIAALPGLGSALAGFCAACFGIAPAVATGAAAGAGVSMFGVVTGVGVLLVVLAVQLRRLRRRCATGRPTRWNNARMVTAVTTAALLSFGLVQWVVTPAITASAPAQPAGQLLP